jgi:hypothetical protein
LEGLLAFFAQAPRLYWLSMMTQRVYVWFGMWDWLDVIGFYYWVDERLQRPVVDGVTKLLHSVSKGPWK